MPAPIPACLPFSVNSTLARSSSWRTRVAVWSDSCLSSSGTDRSLSAEPLLLCSAIPPPLDVQGHHVHGSQLTARTISDACGRASTRRARSCLEVGDDALPIGVKESLLFRPDLVDVELVKTRLLVLPDRFQVVVEVRAARHRL